LARIDIGPLTLNVEERGAGPAFIFIPGLQGLLDAWEYQVSEFSQRYRCVTFDKRGHGRSEQTAHGYDHDTLNAAILSDAHEFAGTLESAAGVVLDAEELAADFWARV